MIEAIFKGVLQEEAFHCREGHSTQVGHDQIDSLVGSSPVRGQPEQSLDHLSQVVIVLLHKLGAVLPRLLQLCG